MVKIPLMVGVLAGSAVLVAGCTGSDSIAAKRSRAGAVLVERRPGIPNRAETLTVRSQILGEDRSVYIQLPDGYEQSSQHYPLLLVMDGEWLFDLAAAHARYYALDEVTDVKIPRLIVVGIPNTDRDRDYTPTRNSGKEMVFPTAGKAEEFLGFLERELLPLLDGRYRTLPGRAIAGWSFSGLFSAWAAVARPDLFSFHLCISPAIWWDDDLILERMQTATFAQPKRMVFTLGAGEAGGWVYESTKRLLRRLEEDPVPGLSVSDFEFPQVGHSWGVASAMDKGLQALFAGYIAPQEIVDGGSRSIDEYYGELSRQWGYPVVPPNKVLQAAAAREWEEGDRDAAIEMLKRALLNDPHDSVTQYELGARYESWGDAERALSCFNHAIRAEQRKPVPNEVNMRAYRDAVAGLADPAGPEAAGR